MQIMRSNQRETGRQNLQRIWYHYLILELLELLLKEQSW